jgi:hypothetical protein
MLDIGSFRIRSGILFFFIKCKNITYQKYARDQQYKKKGTKSLEQNVSKTSLLNRNQREQAPLNNHKQDKLAKIEQSKGSGILLTNQVTATFCSSKRIYLILDPS